MSSKRHTAREQGPAGIERPRMAAPAGNMAEFGSDVVAETLRALDVPYIAINPGASFRGLHDSLVNHLGNEQPAAPAVPARGGRRCHRPWLRQGDRSRHGGRRPFQRRPVPRHHGHVQCLVRSHAGAGDRRHRPGRCRQAPAVDRLDPHRPRPGRHRARLHQMGRPAGQRRGGARGGGPRLLDRQHGSAGPDLRRAGRRAAGGAAGRAAAVLRRAPLDPAPLRPGPRRRRSIACGRCSTRHAGS